MVIRVDGGSAGHLRRQARSGQSQALAPAAAQRSAAQRNAAQQTDRAELETPLLPKTMGPLPNLVYYAAAAKGTVVLAEHLDGGLGALRGPADDNEAAAAAAAAAVVLRDEAAQLAERVGACHSRYAFTAGRRHFCCVMDEDGLAVRAIADEALSKADVFAFLDDTRDAVRKALRRRGLPPGAAAGLGARCLDADIGPVMRRLAAPYVGVPQEEVLAAAEHDAAAAAAAAGGGGRLAPPPGWESAPPPPQQQQQHQGHHQGHHHHQEKADKKKVKEQVSQVKEIMMSNSGQVLHKGEKLEILVGGGAGGGGSSADYGAGGPPDYGVNGGGHHGHHGHPQQQQQQCPVRMKGQQQLAQRTWWRNVKLVLLLDVIVCLVLFLIWLGICKGFQCLKQR